MDRTGISVVVICAALLGWWFYEQNKFAQAQARYAAAHPAPKPQAASAAAPGATPAATVAPGVKSEFLPADATAPELVLTNGRARYTFTARGGGLQKIEFLDYPETISPRWRGKITNNTELATLNSAVLMPVLTVLGDTNFIGDGRFELSRSGNTVRAEKNLPDGLRLSKTFTLTSNYLVDATVKIENISDKTVLLSPQEIVIGTASPMDADDAYNFLSYGGAMWYDGKDVVNNGLTYFNTNTTTMLGLMSRTPTPTYRAGSGNVKWGAAHNQFFALMAMPQEPAREFFAQPVTLPRFQNVGDASQEIAPQGIQASMIYPSQTLAANSALEHKITLFAGPKEYRRLAVIAEQFNNHSDQVMNFGTGFASFWGVGTFFAKLLLSAMNAIHDVTKIGYGWTIVILTFLLRLLFWPLTKASTISMKRMQALTPQLTALKDKYKDDPQKMAQKQWDLYRENKVNPMSGCWPMLMQMPVFIGFFTMIRSAIELRGASFLWAADLSKSDTIALIPGLNFPINPLPLLMGGAMLWQSHLMPASPGMDPAQQKLMRWMPAIFIVFLYNYSAGLALYMTVSTLLGILQTKLTKNIQVPAAAQQSPLTPASKKKK